MHAPGDIRTARRPWLIALAVGAFVVGLAPLADGDLWWHLAAGREMVRTHAFLRTDPFSTGAAGRPWVDVHWLFQLAAYGVHGLGGLRAIVLAKCLLVAAGAAVLGVTVARAAGTRALALFAAAFVAALFAARALLLPRPVIATLLFLAVDFALLEAFRRDGRLAWLAPLPLLQVAWANVQALSIFGPFLVAAYALSAVAWRTFGARRWFPFGAELDPGVDGGRAARALLVVGALCVAACFATPYGARALALPFGLLGRFWPGAGNVYGANVAENVPPWVVERTAPGQFGHLGPYLALVAACLAAAPRIVLSRLAVVVALAALALAGNRNVLLLYWLATPIAVISVVPALRRWRVALRAKLREHKASLVAARWAPRGALAAVLLFASVAAARETSLAAPASWRAPVRSAEIVAARGGVGTIFAADQFGGYLIWTLGPEHRPFMDTRLVLRTPREFEEYLAVVDDPRLFDAWERDKGFAYVLLPVAYPDRYLSLIAHLYKSERWRLVFTDGGEALFARRTAPGEAALNSAWDLSSPAVVDRIGADLSRRFRGEPRLHEAARASLATLLLAVGTPAEAERVLGGLASPRAEALRARCRLAAGDLEGAERIAQATLERDPSDVASLDVLAVVAARRSESDRAREFLRRALDIDPYDVEAGHLLARSEGP
jgi:hypothetical protein